MFNIFLFIGFIGQMLIGVPLYAALLMTGVIGILGQFDFTARDTPAIFRRHGQFYVNVAAFVYLDGELDE